jgi:hypothetical protein
MLAQVVAVVGLRFKCVCGVFLNHFATICATAMVSLMPTINSSKLPLDAPPIMIIGVVTEVVPTGTRHRP